MKKKTYEAPTVEQMQCQVEKGFSGSGNQEPSYQTQQLEEGFTIEEYAYT